MVDFTLNQTWPIFYNYEPVYKIWIQYTNLYKKISKGKHFWRWKRAITPIIMGGFDPKSNLTSIYDYIPVYKYGMNPIH